jgi:type II secretory pathway pseudopilin PulG
MLRVVQRNGHPGVCSSDGYTLLDMIFVVALLAVLTALAAPALLRGRAAANETATLATVRSVHSGQLAYAVSCGAGFWASNFPALADPGATSGFLPPDLTGSPTPTKSGYTYTLTPGVRGPAGLADCNGNPVALDYYVTAVPLAFGETGSRAFASDEAFTIWQDTTGAAPVQPFTPAATVSAIQ